MLTSDFEMSKITVTFAGINLLLIKVEFRRCQYIIRMWLNRRRDGSSHNLSYQMSKKIEQQLRRLH
jgi:hypothetical protein